MAYQQPQLFTPPLRYHDLQQPEQTLEEVAIQLDLLALRGFTLGRHSTLALPFLRAQRRGFLLGNGISNAIDQS